MWASCVQCYTIPFWLLQVNMKPGVVCEPTGSKDEIQVQGNDVEQVSSSGEWRWPAQYTTASSLLTVGILLQHTHMHACVCIYRNTMIFNVSTIKNSTHFSRRSKCQYTLLMDSANMHANSCSINGITLCTFMYRSMCRCVYVRGSGVAVHVQFPFPSPLLRHTPA